MTGHHRCAVNVYLRLHGATFRVERHPGAAQTALHRRGTSLVAQRRCDAGNIHIHRRGVPFTARHSAAVAPPRQSCANVAQGEWQSTTAVPPLCACAAMTQFLCTNLAMVYPPGKYSSSHGGVCTSRSANLRDNPCRGDVSSVVVTASRVVGEPRRLAQAPLWCNCLGHVPSRCTYRGARC